MPNFNRTILIGHLTADPELSFLPTQTAKVDFSIAVNHRFKKQDGSIADEASFFNCIGYGNRASNFQKYHSKGDAVMIEGRLKQERWEKDGRKRSRVVVIMEQFTFVKQRNDQDQSYGDNERDGIPF